MLSPEYGAVAEEKKKKEQEAQAFAERMNKKYNNSEREKFAYIMMPKTIIP